MRQVLEPSAGVARAEPAPGAARAAGEGRAGLGEPEEAQAWPGPPRSACLFPALCKARKGGTSPESLQDRKRRRHLNMEKLCNENEGKLESEGKPEDEVEPENEGKSDEEEKLKVEGKSEHARKLQNEGRPEDEGSPYGKGKQEKQGKSEAEGKPYSEGKPESQAKPESEPRAAEKRPAEDYVPRKAKRKTDRGTDDSPKNRQEDLQERHLGSEEMMRECGDMSRAQEELRKKQKMSGFHWMQRDVQDPFTPRGQRGVRGMRGGGRGQRGLHDIPYL
ncbi:Transcription elongation factor A protein-like 3 [Camelus dromedarius]|uniref:Transcription elongation factor A protein-like 3 n=2 Tax=Camelidae TaxID=9835 RepID=A0A5N4C1Y3_CAMDR|nr:Transcription elongation factor A protein-like 3 [Camelus dromedarius]